MQGKYVELYRTGNFNSKTWLDRAFVSLWIEKAAWYNEIHSRENTLKHYPEMQNMWRDHMNRYLIKLLEEGLHWSSASQKPFEDMCESECDKFIKHKGYLKQSDAYLSPFLIGIEDRNNYIAIVLKK